MVRSASFTNGATRGSHAYAPSIAAHLVDEAAQAFDLVGRDRLVPAGAAFEVAHDMRERSAVV
jgi:hypothetical protein